MQKSSVKTQNQVEKSVKQKTHTCNLTILSYKGSTQEIGKGSTECFERERVLRGDEQLQKFEGKTEKV